MADELDTIISNYEEGLQILSEFFKLTDKEIKEKLKTVLPEHTDLIQHGYIKRIILSEEPRCIEISYFDAIIINPLAIQFKPEVGLTRTIIDFDKFRSLKEQL